MSSQTRTAGRQRPIRLMLALVFVIPLVSLLALWGFAASVTFSNAVQEHNFNGEDNLYGGAAENLAINLATERGLVFAWLASAGHMPETTMLGQFAATEKAVTAFMTGVQMNYGAIISSARPSLAAYESELRGLPNLHAAIEAGRLSAFAAFQDYNTIADSEFDLYTHLVYVGNVELYQQAEASVEAGRALEMADRELTLIGGTLVDGGFLTRPELQSFAQDVAIQRFLMTDALKQLHPSLGSGYLHVTQSAAYRSFQNVENSIVNSIGRKGPLPVNLGFVPLETTLFNRDFRAAETQDRIALSNLGTQIGNRLLLELALAGGVGLVAVVASVFLMTRFARRVSRELRGLQGAALQLATDKLPGVVERLGQGEDVDVAAEAAPIPTGRIAEITKVSHSFGAVQRMAVESAVGQARLRRGVSQVFRNLAWRSQSLLHRQLSLLDAMERKTTDPDALEELFRLDHLTTRMRRHAEGLIILSGAEPGRAWRDPVPILDVLRGAIAEIEDYKRVNVLTDSEDAVVGSVVADMIHLLAELVENATFYSPATTEVTVKAGRVANGFAVEIEDRGIGISEDELAKINDRLVNPPEFDPVNSDQLGLFVVARLAARHNIRITLRQSPYGGTAAIVLLPHAIVVARGRVYTDLDGAIPGWLQSAQRAAIPPALDRATLRGFGGDAGPDEPERPFGIGAPGVPGPATASSPAGTVNGDGTPVVGASGTASGDGTPVIGASGLPRRRPRVTSADGSGIAGNAAVPSPAAPLAGPVGMAPAVPSAGPVGAAPASPAAPLAGPFGSAPGAPLASPVGSAPAGPFGSAPAGPVGTAPAPLASPTGTAPAGVTPVGTAPAGLPRRVRQASLAPQLKTDISAQTDDAAEPDATDGRSPDASRALVDALQFGWQRGRTDAEDGETVESPEHAVSPDDRTEGLGGSDVWTGREGS
jgi:signal transduction histidine kinase